MRRRRLLAILLVVVAASAAGLSAVAAYLVHARQDRILAAVGRGLGRSVRAERLGVSLRGGLGVALRDVAIGEDPAFGSDASFLTASTLAMRLRLLPLLARRLVVDAVLVEEPVVHLVRDASGRLNVETLGRPGTTPAPSAPPPPSGPAPGAGHPAFQIASVRLRHGTITYAERATGRSIELRDVAVDAREPRFGAPVPVAVRATLAGRDLRLDDIVSEGVLDLSTDPPAYAGSLRAGPGALGSLPLARLRATVRAKAPDVTLDAATLELLGGAVSGNASLASAGPEAGLRAQVSGQRLDLARLPAREDRPRPAGTLGFEGRVTGPPPGGGNVASALAGTGSFRVADGRVAGAGVGPAILEILGPVIGSGGTDRLRARYPDLFGSADLRFTQCSGSGRLAEGRIRSDDLVLASASYDARGEGTLDLDGDVDVTLRIAASSALTDDLLGRSKARPFLTGTDGRLTIPLRLRGPLHHPRVTPEADFAARIARGLLGGTGLGDTAGTLLEQLFGGKRKR